MPMISLAPWACSKMDIRIYRFRMCTVVYSCQNLYQGIPTGHQGLWSWFVIQICLDHLGSLEQTEIKIILKIGHLIGLGMWLRTTKVINILQNSREGAYSSGGPWDHHTWAIPVSGGQSLCVLALCPWSLCSQHTWLVICSSQFKCYKEMKSILKLISFILSSEMSARDTVNPPKPYKEVFEAARAGHDLYIVSHNDYFVGKSPPVWNRPENMTFRILKRDREMTNLKMKCLVML